MQRLWRLSFHACSYSSAECTGIALMDWLCICSPWTCSKRWSKMRGIWVYLISQEIFLCHLQSEISDESWWYRCDPVLHQASTRSQRCRLLQRLPLERRRKVLELEAKRLQGLDQLKPRIGSVGSVGSVVRMIFVLEYFESLQMHFKILQHMTWLVISILAGPSTGERMTSLSQEESHWANSGALQHPKSALWNVWSQDVWRRARVVKVWHLEVTVCYVITVHCIFLGPWLAGLKFRAWSLVASHLRHTPRFHPTFSIIFL